VGNLGPCGRYRDGMRFVLWFVAVALCLPSCGKPTGPMDKVAAKAATPAGTRAALAQDIVKGVKAKTFGISNAIDMAHKRLEAASAGSSGASTDQAASKAATSLAGAVLDAVVILGDSLPQGAEHEIFWMQVGRLAFRAGEEAFANERLQEASTLVMGGGKRWQNEPYWQRYSDHDGLASAILAAQGDRSGAIARLQSRADLNGVALEVYQKLTGGR
jgi:hypothetical protein